MSQNLSESNSDVQSIITLSSQAKQQIHNPVKFKKNRQTKQLLNKIAEEQIQNFTEEELNNLIGDDDIRFQTASRRANTLINHFNDNQIKQEYVDYEILLQSTSYINQFILISVILILAFSTPEWCDNTQSITEDCKKTLDPGKFPILIDGEEKNILLILCGLILQASNFLKLKICEQNKREQKIFYLMLFMNGVQILLFLLQQSNIVQLRLMDLLIVFQVVLGVPTLKNNFEYLIRVMINTKEIFIFCFIFLYTFATACFIFFSHIKECYDNNGIGTFSTFNFTTFSTSFYSVIQASLHSVNVSFVIFFLQGVFKSGIILFLVFSLISIIFLQNLMISIMYSEYINTFGEDVDRIKDEYPKLALQMKRDILGKNLTTERLTSLTKRAYLGKKLDKEFLSLHIFIEKTQFEINEKDQENKIVKSWLSKLLQNKYYIIFCGLLDVFQLFNIVFSNEYQSDNQINLYTHINYFLLHIYMVQALIELQVRGFAFKGENVISYLTILISLFATSFYYTTQLFSNEELNHYFLSKNTIWIKAFNIINVLNSYNGLKLLFLNELIKTIFQVIINSLSYIADILFIMFTVILIYSSFGMMLFGGHIHSKTIDEINKLQGSGIDPIFASFNFNDYYNSMITLITILYSDYINVTQANNNYEKGVVIYSYYAFFVSFAIITQLCLTNIIYGFLIDNCQNYLVELMGDKINRNEYKNLDVNFNRDQFSRIKPKSSKSIKNQFQIIQIKIYLIFFQFFLIQFFFILFFHFLYHFQSLLYIYYQSFQS